METLTKLIFITVGFFLVVDSAAQDGERGDEDQLRIAAIEALITAPPERALPLVDKVLVSNNSNELKKRALFILSQIDREEAREALLNYVRESTGELQVEAIRMIGISGSDKGLAFLKDTYLSLDGNGREAAIEAFMIAGDKQAVFEIALTTEGDEYERAIDMLGTMGAQHELRELHKRNGISEALINAYATSGDFNELRKMALDGSDPQLQMHAIQAMGVVGGDEVNATLVQIYRDSESDDVREAAMNGMLISGHDEGVLELYRSTDDPERKKELLEQLIIMGSDEVWGIIDGLL